MIKYIVLQTLIYILFVSRTYAQSVGTDSRGKDVFNFYTTKTLSLPISSSNSSIKLGYSIPTSFFQGNHGKQYWVESYYKLSDTTKKDLGTDPRTKDTITIDTINKKYLNDTSITSQTIINELLKNNKISLDSANFTLATSYSLNVSVSATNLGNNLSNLTTFHPSYGLNIGFSHNIDLFNNWNKLKTVDPKTFFTWSISIYAILNNLLVYDTINKSATRQRPLTAGIIGELSIFSVEHRWIAMSISVNYENGNNISDLKNYQKNNPYYLNSNVISLGDYIGKLGDEKSRNTFRLRFSLPIFIDGFKSPNQFDSGRFLNRLTHLCVIPYYSIYGDGSNPFNLIGAFIDLLGEGYGYKNAKIVSGGGVGFDWIDNGSKWSKANVFVSGNISIESLFQHSQHASR